MGLIVVLALVIFYQGASLKTIKAPVQALTPIQDETFELTIPEPGERVSSPVAVEGRARGIWFFEGSFPVSVTDYSGNIIGQGHVTALSDWMTNDFVTFKGNIEFSTLKKGRGYIVFKKDNPSGLPENDKQVSVEVFFK